MKKIRADVLIYPDIFFCIALAGQALLFCWRQKSNQKCADAYITSTVKP